MTTPAFATAIAELRDDANRQRTAIMCAEAVHPADTSPKQLSLLGD